ncbi:hypothetical protein AcV7_003192 [Taiwanofungus camphoratus]|nr:hypothetical protein AcV7_003192 [Antrodia cinnamomea]
MRPLRRRIFLHVGPAFERAARKRCRSVVPAGQHGAFHDLTARTLRMMERNLVSAHLYGVRQGSAPTSAGAFWHRAPVDCCHREACPADGDGAPHLIRTL